MHTFGKITGILQWVRCLNIGTRKPTVGRPFLFGFDTALLHITSDTRNTTYMYEVHLCECILLLATFKRCNDAENPGYICCIVSLTSSCLLCSASAMPVSLGVCVCVCVRYRVNPCPNLNETNRRCYDPPETTKWGAKSKR